jgi:acyl-CoA thioester hydrolase
VTRLFVPVQLRWSDLDAYGHVNNVEMFRLLEEARITAFWAHPQEDQVAAPPDLAAPAAWPTAVLDSGPGASSHTFVARQEIEYLRPLGFDRRPVRVEMWIGHMGGASLDVCYEVHDDGTPSERTGEGSSARPVARAVTTIVLVSAATGSPRRIAPHERAAWEPFLGEPISFRRRGA